MKATEKDYLAVCCFYIHRKLLFALLLAGTAVFLLFFQQDVQQWLDSIRGKAPAVATFLYNDTALASYEGRVRILNSSHNVIYEGLFQDGACNGKGLIYDEQGHVLYRGLMVNNRMQDEEGQLFYKDGTLAYHGAIKDNYKDGTGVQYRTDGTLEYEGEFQLDVFSGHGKEYSEQEQLVYEGEYLNGQRHGSGIAYEHTSRKRAVYQGEFAFGNPQGQGTFYDTLGKAYYTGAVYEGHMDLTSFLPSSLADLEEAFHTPYDIYVLQQKVLIEKNGRQETATVQKTAIVYPLHKLIFFTQYPLPLDTSNEVWQVSKELDPSKVFIESIEMVDANLDDPSMRFLTDTIQEAWSKRATERVVEKKADYFDLFALYYTEDRSAIEAKKNITITARGNRIYEMEAHGASQQTKRSMYLVNTYSVGYGYPLDHKQPLYSLLLDEHLEVRAK